VGYAAFADRRRRRGHGESACVRSPPGCLVLGPHDGDILVLRRWCSRVGSAPPVDQELARASAARVDVVSDRGRHGLRVGSRVHVWLAHPALLSSLRSLACRGIGESMVGGELLARCPDRRGRKVEDAGGGLLSNGLRGKSSTDLGCAFDSPTEARGHGWLSCRRYCLGRCVLAQWELTLDYRGSWLRRPAWSLRAGLAQPLLASLGTIEVGAAQQRDEADEAKHNEASELIAGVRQTTRRWSRPENAPRGRAADIIRAGGRTCVTSMT